MKIALIEDFSSLHKYLKEGLQELGTEVVLASSGDGWKKIRGADIKLPVISDRNICHRINYFKELNSFAQSVVNYDVVQVMNTNLFSCFNNTYIMKNLKKNNKIFSVVSAGDDYAYFKAYKSGRYKYHAYNYIPQKRVNSNTLKGRLRIRSGVYVENISDIIIPTMYDYTLGYDTPKLYRIIPLPINVSSIEYRENIIKDKIIFFHGLNRELEKGTPLIREALKKLKSKYPNDVEVIIDGHMPFDKYTELMRKVNVVIDQCYDYAYGINSCIAMAQGKVVVTSCKNVAIDAMGASYNPFVSILPDVNDIYGKLCTLVENRNKIQEMGYRSRKFVENYHDHVTIAQNYLEAWNSVKK